MHHVLQNTEGHSCIELLQTVSKGLLPVTGLCCMHAGFKLCSLTEVEEMFEQRYSSKLRLSTALVTRSALVMSPPALLVRVLLNLKNIYTGLQQADKVLQITDYLRSELSAKLYSFIAGNTVQQSEQLS